ncbi:hypothetical protein MHYP_G00287050 [Metynnis hypsauchen]
MRFPTVLTSVSSVAKQRASVELSDWFLVQTHTNGFKYDETGVHLQLPSSACSPSGGGALHARRCSEDTTPSMQCVTGGRGATCRKI